MGIWRSLTDHFTTLHMFAFEHTDIAPLRNQGFHRIAFGRGDDQPAFTLGLLTEADCARCFRQNCRLLRLTSLEEVGDSRQTTGDIPSLGAFLRNPGNDIAYSDLLFVLEIEDGIMWQEDVYRYIAARQHNFVAFAVDQAHGRTEVLASARPILWIEHGDIGQPR